MTAEAFQNSIYENDKLNVILKVRDYECDMQGVVNHAVYFNYLEYARQKYLHHKGLGFKKLIEINTYIITYRIEIEFKRFLKSGNEFKVSTMLKHAGKFTYVFQQMIFRQQEKVAEAQVYVVPVDQQGQPAQLYLK